MPRVRPDPLPPDLRDCERRWVSPSALADHLGEKAGTIRKWCRLGKVPGAKRRDPVGNKNSGDWMIPIEGAMVLESRLGFTRRNGHHAA